MAGIFFLSLDLEYFGPKNGFHRITEIFVSPLTFCIEMFCIVIGHPIGKYRLPGKESIFGRKHSSTLLTVTLDGGRLFTVSSCSPESHLLSPISLHVAIWMGDLILFPRLHVLLRGKQSFGSAFKAWCRIGTGGSWQMNSVETVSKDLNLKLMRLSFSQSSFVEKKLRKHC